MGLLFDFKFCFLEKIVDVHVGMISMCGMILYVGGTCAQDKMVVSLAVLCGNIYTNYNVSK